MGSIGTSQSAVNTNFNSLPSTNIKPLKPTKRSEEVFNRLYTDLRVLAKNSLQAEEYNMGGYNSLYKDEWEDVYSKRMIQGIQFRLNNTWQGIELNTKLGISNPEKDKPKKYALIMLQKMLNRYYDSMNTEFGRRW